MSQADVGSFGIALAFAGEFVVAGNSGKHEEPVFVYHLDAVAEELVLIGAIETPQPASAFGMGGHLPCSWCDVICWCKAEKGEVLEELMFWIGPPDPLSFLAV